MPCYDERDSTAEELAAARKEFRHNSDVAEMLCRLCHLIEDDPGIPNLLDVDTQRWFEEHKKRDANKADRSSFNKAKSGMRL